MEVFLDNGDPKVKAACEELPLPKRLMRTVAMEKSARIAIKAGKKILFIDVADIIAVEAEGNYVLLQHKSSRYLLRESISRMAEKLSLFGFVRIHRSSLVNAAFAEEIQLLSTGKYVLRIRGGKKYMITRSFKKNLHLLAESWIGTNGFVQI